MSNNISVKGHISKNAELKSIGENKVLEWNFADNVGYGEKELTNWYRCTMWGKVAERMKAQFVKGKELLLFGELRHERYTNKEGIEVHYLALNVRDFDFCGRKDK
jgi:single-strand DNA-binding protein